MRRIGEFKAASHRDRLAEHLSLSLEERLQRSWRLFEALCDSVAEAREDDDPTAFYDRARALGLYRP